jgi:hypothetical protein
MAHEADKWIASRWMDRKVRQVGGLVEYIGRSGVVEDTMYDEKGVLHCLVKREQDDLFWCPAHYLAKVEE